MTGSQPILERQIRSGSGSDLRLFLDKRERLLDEQSWKSISSPRSIDRQAERRQASIHSCLPRDCKLLGDGTFISATDNYVYLVHSQFMLRGRLAKLSNWKSRAQVAAIRFAFLVLLHDIHDRGALFFRRESSARNPLSGSRLGCRWFNPHTRLFFQDDRFSRSLKNEFKSSLTLQSEPIV